MADLRTLFMELIASPTRENYLRAWEVVTTSTAYRPYGGALRQIEHLLEQGQFAESILQCEQALPVWLLSPRLHVLTGFAASKLGDLETARMEGLIAARLVAAIQATGDGSADRPYLVSSTSDEYDVLEYAGKSAASQALLKQDGRAIDRLTCADGAIFHFDITRPYQTLAGEMVTQAAALKREA